MVTPMMLRWMAVGLMAWSIVPIAQAAGEKEVGAAEIAKWISQLDNEEFAIRRGADRKLLECGKVAIPSLLAAAKSDSPELKVRAAKLVERIRQRIVLQEFELIGKQKDEDVDVEHAMWAMALLLDPDLERKTVSEQLDAMAAAVRKKVGDQIAPKDLPPEKAVAVLVSVLRDDFGLAGDTKSYSHPDNSSIQRVIARKKGLPILLSEIAVAVAKRLEIPIVGLGIPGRYMIKYDAARAPAGHEKKMIIINPYEGWREMTVVELRRAILGFNPVEDLFASPPRDTIHRMLRNMANHASFKGRRELVAAILDCAELVEPGGRLVP